MEFGNDPHPKWSEKEEMTLIFLAALNPTYNAPEIRGEINALFGNERSLESVKARIEKDDRAILALRDLAASNPVTIAKFWQAQGVVDQLPLVPMEEEEKKPTRSLLYHQLRVLFPEVRGNMSEEDISAEIYRRLNEAEGMSIRRITTDAVEFDERVRVSATQISGVIKALKNH